MRGATNAENVLEVDVDGFEGPLDILLNLARVQKVDLKQISILQLAEQYLEFIGKVQSLKIEIAADYLVMASWLAYLKSRLLLPKENDDETVSAEEMAARLVFQLQRLEAMRDASAKLMTRNQLGRDFFS
ncbi:MAG: ScpA family protein, partial [Pseudomonadota bacterium]|nr:ScpA family protein [Pseudomonadota bacterium]